MPIPGLFPLHGDCTSAALFAPSQNALAHSSLPCTLLPLPRWDWKAGSLGPGTRLPSAQPQHPLLVLKGRCSLLCLCLHYPCPRIPIPTVSTRLTFTCLSRLSSVLSSSPLRRISYTPKLALRPLYPCLFPNTGVQMCFLGTICLPVSA